ncbi:uncharacterized protein [Pocillopora verrucosa]|uniref:uncharacterized protein isoform X2 n=1 Tax=Pocillopora verrucosa TaxID=203993 RepID=UPI00334148C4
MRLQIALLFKKCFNSRRLWKMIVKNVLRAEATKIRTYLKRMSCWSFVLMSTGHRDLTKTRFKKLEYIFYKGSSTGINMIFIFQDYLRQRMPSRGTQLYKQTGGTNKILPEIK